MNFLRNISVQLSINGKSRLFVFILHISIAKVLK